jgi:hypothetical protein
MKKLILFILIYLTQPGYSNAQHIQFNWQGCYNGPLDDEIFDVVSTGDGYMMVGSYEKNSNIPPSYFENDVWLIKTDLTGNFLWQKFLGGSNSDAGVRIFPTQDGNYLIAGGSVSSDGDISNDPYPQSDDYWIIKINGNGSIIWDRILGGNGKDQIRNGTLTTDGGFVALGYTSSDDGDISHYYGAYDMWMIKLNANGEKVWDFTIGTSWFDDSQAIIQTSEGGYLIGGSSIIESGGNIDCTPFNNNSEVVVFKLDSNANIQWQHCYGGSGNDGVADFIELKDGYLIAAQGESADGDLTGSGWHGDMDVWLIKVDFNGNIIWQKCFGGSDYDYPSRIFKTSDSTLIIFGTTRSFDGDVVGNHSLEVGIPDIWMLKVSLTGNLTWQQCIGGQGEEWINFGVIQRSNVDYVLTGTISSGQSGDIICGSSQVINYGAWAFSITDTTTYDELPYAGYKPASFKVYPNPASDYVVFEQLGLKEQKQEENNIQIRNIFGDMVETLEIIENKAIWSLEKVKSGVYLYRINGDSKVGKVFVSRK